MDREAAVEKCFYVKVYRVQDQVLVAACDAELLGKTVRTESGVEVLISERFYGGELLEPERAREAMRSATSLNLVGNRIVNLALSSEIGHPDSVIMVDGVAHLILIHV
ncbi:MAG: DUF424 family protein [Candidatus Brockarchaeota archaeon]|nr:DUF424 family protein [Candidatus Brockarchaeota archaeon]